jgi:hypothetical protein
MDQDSLSVHRVLRVAGESAELRVVDSLQPRACQVSGDLSKRALQLSEGACQDVWLSLRRKLVDEAGQVVTLEQGARVVKTTREVIYVHGCEGISGASVSGYMC